MYNVVMNSSPDSVPDFSNIPIKVAGGIPVLMENVGQKIHRYLCRPGERRARQWPARQLPGDPEEIQRLDALAVIGPRQGALPDIRR